MVEANLKYASDPQLLLDVVSAMPKRVDNTLTSHRNKLLGMLQSTGMIFSQKLSWKRLTVETRSWSLTH